MHNEIKIIHLSDFHFGQTSLYLSDFFSKRITGYVNLKRHRSKHFPIGLKNKIIQKVEQTSYDYLFITGDLTNLARESEFAEARERLDPILKKGKTIIIPGNHDRYVRSAAKQDWIQEYFGDFFPLSWKTRKQEGNFFIQDLNQDIVLVGVDMAVPRTYFSARGKVNKKALEKCSRLLNKPEYKEKVKIAIGHYPIWVPKGIHDGVLHQLAGKLSMRKFLSNNQFSLYCHGHVHKSWIYKNPNSSIINVNSGGSCRYDSGRWAGFHEILISSKNVHVKKVLIDS
ncbi:MAG: 3',5'-cyclic AMP phosphodiesterase CpdA [bacterium]|jgi:3',5'-cyclic AMP phosphodiesterase CpdA